MRIYRIEHSAALRDDLPAGPYSDVSFMEIEHPDTPWFDLEDDDCDGDCLHVFADRISWISDEDHPTPYKDNIDEVEGMLFGFDEMSRLVAWFGEWFSDLHYHGFVIAVYEVENVKHGYRQSVFDPATAVRVHDMWVPRSVSELV